MHWGYAHDDTFRHADDRVRAAVDRRVEEVVRRPLERGQHEYGLAHF